MSILYLVVIKNYIYNIQACFYLNDKEAYKKEKNKNTNAFIICESKNVHKTRGYF